MQNGITYLDQLRLAAQQVHDYSTVTALHLYKGRRFITESGHFYFKKPNMMRLEVLEGRKRGSIVVLDKAGKVHVRLGGFLRHVPIQLDRHSHMLRLETGFSVVEGDFANLLAYMNDLTKNGGHVLVTESPVAVDALHKSMNVLEIENPHAKFDPSVYLLGIDPATNLPLQCDMYRHGHLFASTTWSKIKLDPGLSDHIFTL